MGNSVEREETVSLKDADVQTIEQLFDNMSLNLSSDDRTTQIKDVYKFVKKSCPEHIDKVPTKRKDCVNFLCKISGLEKPQRTVNTDLKDMNLFHLKNLQYQLRDAFDYKLKRTDDILQNEIKLCQHLAVKNDKGLSLNLLKEYATQLQNIHSEIKLQENLVKACIIYLQTIAEGQFIPWEICDQTGKHDIRLINQMLYAEPYMIPFCTATLDLFTDINQIAGRRLRVDKEKQVFTRSRSKIPKNTVFIRLPNVVNKLPALEKKIRSIRSLKM